LFFANSRTGKESATGIGDILRAWHPLTKGFLPIYARNGKSDKPVYANRVSLAKKTAAMERRAIARYDKSDVSADLLPGTPR
jgi:hypothetical protein